MRGLAPLGVFLLAFTLYAGTAAPSVGPGHDSGELTTAAYCLGVAHPPGYPLYVRLAHGWGALLGGDYGWRINLFSGFCTALAAAGLTWLLQRSTKNLAAGLISGLGFALLGSVWRQAVVAEVFGLHFALLTALAALGWLVLERCRQGQAPGPPLWGFYAVLGLCVAHQHVFVLALPGLLMLAWGQWRRVLLTPAWVMVGLVAFPFYLDMLLRARAGPPLNWGGVTDAGALWDHFLRKSYGTFKLTVHVEPLEQGVAHGLAYVLFTYLRQAPWPWMLLATYGGLVGRRLQPRLWARAWGWWLAYGPFFALIGRQRPGEFQLDLLERFYASSYLGLAILAGLGAAALAPRLRSGWAGLLVALLLGWQAWANLPECRLDSRELAASYGRLVLRSCPPGSLLLVYGDLPVGVVDYLQMVEGLRPDVHAVCQGLLGSPWYRARVPASLGGVVDEVALMQRAERLGMPVLLTQYRRLPGQWRPRALCWQWYSAVAPARHDRESQCLNWLLEDAPGLRPGLTGESRFWPRYLISARTYGLRQLAAAVFQSRPRAALEALDAVFELGGGQPLDFLNRGLLRQQLGYHKLALDDFARSLEGDSSLELARVATVYSQVYLMVEGPAGDLGAYCVSPP